MTLPESTILAYLRYFNSPMAADGSFVFVDAKADSMMVRETQPFVENEQSSPLLLPSPTAARAVTLTA